MMLRSDPRVGPLPSRRCGKVVRAGSLARTTRTCRAAGFSTLLQSSRCSPSIHRSPLFVTGGPRAQFDLGVGWIETDRIAVEFGEQFPKRGRLP